MHRNNLQTFNEQSVKANIKKGGGKTINTGE